MRGNETIVVHRMVEGGLHGDRTALAPQTIKGCIVYPTEGDEQETSRQDVVISRLTIVKQALLDIKPTDEVTARGVRHDVDGPAQVYRKGSKTYTLVNIKAVE